MPPEMISKRNHFRLLPPHRWVVKRDLQKLLRQRLTFSHFDHIYSKVLLESTQKMLRSWIWR